MEAGCLYPLLRLNHCGGSRMWSGAGGGGLSAEPLLKLLESWVLSDSQSSQQTLSISHLLDVHARYPVAAVRALELRNGYATGTQSDGSRRQTYHI